MLQPNTTPPSSSHAEPAATDQLEHHQMWQQEATASAAIVSWKSATQAWILASLCHADHTFSKEKLEKNWGQCDSAWKTHRAFCSCRLARAKSVAWPWVALTRPSRSKCLRASSLNFSTLIPTGQTSRVWTCTVKTQQLGLTRIQIGKLFSTWIISYISYIQLSAFTNLYNKCIRSRKYPLASIRTCKLQNESSSFWDLKHLCSHKLQKMQDCRKIPELHGSHNPVPTSTFPTHLRLAGGRQAVVYPDHPSSSADTPTLLKSSQVQGVFNWFMNFEFWNHKFFDKELHFWTTLSRKPQEDDSVRCLDWSEKSCQVSFGTLRDQDDEGCSTDLHHEKNQNSSSWAFSELATLWRSCVASLTFIENSLGWMLDICRNQSTSQPTNQSCWIFMIFMRPALVILHRNKSTPNCGWHEPET